MLDSKRNENENRNEYFPWRQLWMILNDENEWRNWLLHSICILWTAAVISKWYLLLLSMWFDAQFVVDWRCTKLYLLSSNIIGNDIGVDSEMFSILFELNNDAVTAGISRFCIVFALIILILATRCIALAWTSMTTMACAVTKLHCTIGCL
jgi:hypothetical protein